LLLKINKLIFVHFQNNYCPCQQMKWWTPLNTIRTLGPNMVLPVAIGHQLGQMCWTGTVWILYYVSPHEMGRHIDFSSVVCPCVRPSVCPSVTLSCPLYILKPWWDFQITLHKCQVWWDDVQCLGLTKVGSRSRSKFKIKHCMTVFWVRSLSFEPMVRFTNNFPEMLAMMRQCAVPMFDQGWFKVKVKN